MTDKSIAANTESTDAPDKKRTKLERQSLPTFGNTALFNTEALFQTDFESDSHDDSMGNDWSVPWSDLMMVMFVLFAVLVTVQELQKKDFQKNERGFVTDKDILIKDDIYPPEPSFKPMMQINVLERSQQAVRETHLDNVEIVLMEDQSVKVSVQGPMLFELGTATLRSEVKQFLSQLAGIIRQTPYQVNVIGHTDDYPIHTDRYPSNWELSLMRATHVAKYIIEQGDIDPSRFTIMGRSEYHPEAPNENDNSRSLNRRVEIIITREKSRPKDARS